MTLADFLKDKGYSRSFVEHFIIPMGEAVIAAAPDRVIWGSDWPHGNTFEAGRIPNDGDLLNVLGAMAPNEMQRRKILVDNPTRLYFSS